MATIKTDLILENKQFGGTILESRKQIENFKSGVATAGSSLVKFAGFLGAGVSAYEVFNKAMNSSQALGDAYGATIQSAQDVTNTFFYSIANGDWSPFLNGLANTISLAKEAYAAMDQLGNTKMSYGYFDSKNQASLQDAIAVLKDKDSTAEQKEAAKKQADQALRDQKEITEQFSRRSKEAMSKLVQASTGFKDLDVSQMNLEKSIRLDVSALGDDEKKVLAAKYKEFQGLSEKLKKENTTYKSVNNGTAGWTTVEEIDHKKLSENLKPLLANYQDAIIYNSTLNKESDEWLQNLISIAQASFNAERNYSSMVKSANRASQSGDRGIGGKAVVKAKIGSLGNINDLISAKTTELNLAINDEDRKKIYAELEELENKKVDIEFKFKYDRDPAEINKELSNSFRSGIGDELSSMKIGDDVIESVNRYEKAQGTLNEGAEKTKENFIATNAPLDNLGVGLQGVSDMTEAFGGKAGAMAGSAMQIISKLVVAKQGEAIASGIASAFTLPFPANLAAAAGVLGTIGSLFASIPKFESGGFVPGLSTSGDKILARVNAGELILNKAQQSNLAAHLMDGGGRNVNVAVGGSFKISGRDLVASIEKQNRYNSR